MKRTDTNTGEERTVRPFKVIASSAARAAIASALALLLSLSMIGCQGVPRFETATVDDPSIESMEVTDFEMSAEESLASSIQSKVSSMTLREKVSQMTITRPEDITGSDTSFTDEGGANLANYPFGGICYFGKNLSGEAALRASISGFQEAASAASPNVPMFITVDEEGGGLSMPNASSGTGAPTGVTRLAKAGFAGAQKLYPMYYYKDQGAQVAFDNAALIARYLEDYGFNYDFAPVADTNSNPKNPVIGYRSYSNDFSQAAELVASAVEGFESENMACSLKHFPGHGDTGTDSHLGTAAVDKDLSQIAAQELLPFQAGIDAGADSVMIGHILVDAVDSLPASISHKWVTEILRDQMGFQGVILTDSLGMGALTNEWSNSEIALACVKAGCDVMLLPEDPYEAVYAVVAAVEAGEIPESEIDAHVTRILEMKQRHGIWGAE